jgi:glutathione S-transferase
MLANEKNRMPIKKLKLYDGPATRSARVKWLLHELVDDAFELCQVSLNDAEQYGPEYLAINPNHAVPVLEITLRDGGTMTMFESGAMVALLADAYPDQLLAPPPNSLCEGADYLQMLHFGASWMDMMLWQIKIHEDVLGEPERDTKTAIRYRGKFLNGVEPQLRKRLDRYPFICGAGFLAVDCVIAHMWARLYGLCQFDIFAAYLARLSARPAFTKAFSDLHLFTKVMPLGSPALELFTG